MKTSYILSLNSQWRDFCLLMLRVPYPWKTHCTRRGIQKYRALLKSNRCPHPTVCQESMFTFLRSTRDVSFTTPWITWISSLEQLTLICIAIGGGNPIDKTLTSKDGRRCNLQTFATLNEIKSVLQHQLKVAWFYKSSTPPSLNCHTYSMLQRDELPTLVFVMKTQKDWSIEAKGICLADILFNHANTVYGRSDNEAQFETITTATDWWKRHRPNRPERSRLWSLVALLCLSHLKHDALLIPHKRHGHESCTNKNIVTVVSKRCCGGIERKQAEKLKQKVLCALFQTSTAIKTTTICKAFPSWTCVCAAEEQEFTVTAF